MELKKRNIPISLPHTGEEEWLAAKEPIMTGWLTAGSEKLESLKKFLLNAMV